MKNKKTFFIIYIILISIILISVITLSLLGNMERVGYLSEFKINVDNTLEINRLNIDEIKELFVTNDELDEIAINNYILTNESITNYSYDFRIKYYSKVFRNSDIYGVYLNTNKILENNNYIKKIEMGKNGSPFGNFVSDKIIDFENIDNIDYKLKVKHNFIWLSIVLLIILLCILLICINKDYVYKYSVKLNILLKRYKKIVLKIYFIFAAILIFLILLLSFLGNIERVGYLSEFKINIDNTLKINRLNIDETKELFVINNELDEIAINNYILTNESITNYSYNFRIKYYDKIFRNNDIYNVYLNTNKILENNNYIKKIEMGKNGSPFGILTSTQKLMYDEKIDNVDYNLKIKNEIIIIFIPLLILFLYICFYNKISYFINKCEKRNIIFPIVILLLLLFMYLRNINILLNPQLWAEDGNVFFQEYYDYGLKSIFMPYAGYLHTVPRIIIIISYFLSEVFNKGIILIPMFSVFLSNLVGAYCLGYVCSKDFKWFAPLKLRILLSLLLCFVPYTGEVYNNPTNLHWILGYFLFLVSINMIHNKSIPRGLILIPIFLFSVSSTFVIFIGLASAFLFFEYIFTLIKEKSIKYNIKNIFTKLLNLFVLNIGFIIHTLVIISGKRAGSGNINIMYLIESCIYILLKLFIDIRKLYIDNIFITLILFLSILIIFIKFFKYKYVLIFYILTIIMIFVGNNSFQFYLYNVRYIFIPTSIILTFIIGNFALLYKDKYVKKLSYNIYFLFVCIMCVNYFIFNFSNKFILEDVKWNQFSSMYSKNGNGNIFIPIHPIAYSIWKINVKANILETINDDKLNKIDDYTYFYNFTNYNESFIYCYDANMNFSFVDTLSGIDTNNDGIIDLSFNNFYYKNNIYLIDISEYNNISLILKTRYNYFSNDILIVEKRY